MARWFQVWGLSVGSLILALAWHQIPALSQSNTINQATVTEILQGRQVFIQNRQAKVQDIARLGEQIRTGLSRASLRFNTGAVGRLGTNSSLIVGRQCVQVRQGRILVNGAANTCGRSVVAGVRGTTYLLEVNDEQEQLTVLEGVVNISHLESATNQSFQPMSLNQGQWVKIDRQGAIGAIQTLTKQEYENLLQSDLMQEFKQELPSLNQLRNSFYQLYPGSRFPLDAIDNVHYRNALRRAKNLARQAAEQVNGGLSRYRAENAMHGPPLAAPFTLNQDGSWTFSFKGGPPEFSKPTIQSVVTVSRDGQTVTVNYNGPI